MIAAVEATTSRENQIAESLTGRSYVSWSQLVSFRSCPRKWHYSHVESVEPEFVASSLLFGSAIHSAVQHFYEQQIAGSECDASDLQQRFFQGWQDERKDDIPVRDVVTAKVSGLTGGNSLVLIVHGEMGIGVDLTRTEYVEIDHDNRCALLTVPEPKVMYAKLDHERTRIHSLK